MTKNSCLKSTCWDTRATDSIIKSGQNDTEVSKQIVRLQLHGAIYRPDSFVLMPRYCSNLKDIRYESTSLNRIVADKLHRVIVALAVRLQNDIE